MTSSAPGDEVTLDDVVARVRELSTRLRSLYVETDGWTDAVLGGRASTRAHGLLVPPVPIDPEAARPRRGWRVRSWVVFDPDRDDHPLAGVQPRRGREEVEYTDADGSVGNTTSGFDDTARWSTSSGGAERTDRGPLVGSLSNSWVVGRHWAEAPIARELVGTDAVVLGRECARVRVTSPRRFWAPGRLASGDAHLLDVDRPTGITLALTSFHDGEVFQHYEAVALEVDPDVDADLTSPPGSAAQASPSTNYRSAREVAADAGDLAVLAPTWLPEGYAFGTAGAGAREDGEMHAVLYYRRDASPTVTISEWPAPRAVPDAVDGWTRIERGDRWVAVSDVTDAVGVRLAGTIVAGTAARLHAELSAVELLDVAFSLEPV